MCRYDNIHRAATGKNQMYFAIFISIFAGIASGIQTILVKGITYITSSNNISSLLKTLIL